MCVYLQLAAGCDKEPTRFDNLWALHVPAETTVVVHGQPTMYMQKRSEFGSEFLEVRYAENNPLIEWWEAGCRLPRHVMARGESLTDSPSSRRRFQGTTHNGTDLPHAFPIETDSILKDPPPVVPSKN